MDIVRASHKNAGDIAVLNDAVQKMHAEHYPAVFKYPADTAEMARFFREQIAADDSFIFVAVVSGEAAGYVWASIQRRGESVFKYGTERIYIHQLSVGPEYRRKGVGRALMDAVGAVAREHGIRQFALDSWEFNTEAHAFFERLGFSRFNINMWRETAED